MTDTLTLWNSILPLVALCGSVVLLPVPERANEWIRKPNDAPFLGGSSALQRMLGGQVADLYVVRQYLDAQRGAKA